MKNILDISTWNNLNSKDYDDIANNYEGVIMRIGYTGYGKPAKNKVIDDKFEQHDAELRKRGVKLGVYWYGTDESKAEAEVAAKRALEFAKGRDFPLGVFYDTEDNHYQRAMGKNKLTETVLGFTNYIKKNSNYIVGVYASSSWYKNQLHFDRLKGLIIWEANYGSNNGKLNSKLWYDSHIHQFTSNHIINNKRFDNNKVMKKYWKDSSDEPVVKDHADKTDEQLAAEVWADKHGSGDARRKSLGNRYDSVQSLVDKGHGKPNTNNPKPKPEQTQDKVKIKEGAKYVSKSAKYNGVAVPSGNTGVAYDYKLNTVKDRPSWVFIPYLNSYVDRKDVEFTKSSAQTDTKVIDERSKVKVVNAVHYDTGKSFKVYFDTYDVLEKPKGNRVVIGIGKTVTAAIHKNNLKVV